MGIVYALAALVVVPGLLAAFHLLSRPPQVTSQPAPPAESAEPGVVEASGAAGVADEAERWLRSQSSS